MAKAGSTTIITENDKSFEGSGIEGQKMNEVQDVIDPVDEPESAGLNTSGATSIITNRNGSCQRVWFRDGKEIGSEDV